MTTSPIDFPRLTRSGAGKVSSPNVEHRTGSALQDRLATEHDRIWRAFLARREAAAPIAITVLPQPIEECVEELVVPARSEERPFVTSESFYLKPPKIVAIKRLMAEHFNVSMIDIVSARRGKDIIWPRHIAMYLAKELTVLSYPQIGRLFGHRDHSTVLIAWRKIAKLIANNKLFAEEISALRERLK